MARLPRGRVAIHIAYLIGFANRIVVLTRWAWSFLTHGRGSRLIIGQPVRPEIETPEPPAVQHAAETATIHGEATLTR